MSTVLNGTEEVVLKGKELRIPVPWGFIAAKTWGKPNGEPILGVHGWMDNAGSFDRLAPLLPPSKYFVAIDIHGHGFSSHLPPGIPYNFIDAMLVLKRVVTFLGWTKFSMIGHSLGAGICLTFASLYAEDVDTLILIDLAKPISADTKNVATSIRTAINAFLALDKREAKTTAHSYFDALKIMSKATENAVSEDDAKILMVRGSRQVDEDEYCFTVDPRVSCPQLHFMSHDECFELLKKLTCRCLLIKAKSGPTFESQDLIKRALRIYEENCSEFKHVELEGNHFIHLNKAKEVAEHVNDFLANI